MLIITPSSKEIQIPFEYAGIIPISLATEKRNCVFLSIGNSVIIFRCNLLLFYQIIIALLCPGKVIVTVFAFESTIPVTPSLLAPCKDSTTTTSLYCLVTRSNVSDVVLIVPNTIAVLYICKSILIDFSVISFLFALLFHINNSHIGC